MNTPTKRLSWRTKQDQFYQSFGCGQLHVIRFRGTCEACGRSVYSHGCVGEKPCHDRVESSPDPRGIIPVRHCFYSYEAEEYGMTGRDLVVCYDCSQVAVRYHGIIAAAKNSGTWKPAEQNNCDGTGPHTPGEVRVMPTGGDGHLILCRACWSAELAYQRNRNRALEEFAQYTLLPWADGKVYDGQT